MSGGQWGFWLALAAMVAAIGKFLDDYHVDSKTKIKMRDLLVRWFLWLDESKVPDAGGAVLRFARKIVNIPTIITIIIVLNFVYILTISTFYFGRKLYGPPVDESFVSYLAHWLSPYDPLLYYWIGFLVLIITPGIFGLIVTAFFFNRASLTSSDMLRIAYLLGGIACGAIVSVLGAAVSPLLFPGVGYGIHIILFAGVISLAIPALFAIFTLLLIIVRLLVKLAKFLTLTIFDVASSPKNSPFTYASALLSVAILLAKVIQAAVR